MIRAIYNVLLDPLFLGLVVLYASLIALWRSEARRSVKVRVTLAALVLTILSTPAFNWLAARTLESDYPPLSHRPSDASAIVVLGGGLYPATDPYQPGVLARDSLYRCLYAAELYHRDGPCTVAVSGGKLDPRKDGDVVAEAMRDFLVRHGVSEADILVEGESATTYENAVKTHEILEPRGAMKIVLVTDACHLPRATACFRKQGFEVIPAGCSYRSGKFKWEVGWFLPRVGAAGTLDSVIHEWVGLGWYWLRGQV